ncbi:MAG: succinyl-diaminopimelate desuccinylase [Pseudomonadota bacterium]|nr:succinyl-diaminopimelate desuccinylase [Pseudomonadota bacterium]
MQQELIQLANRLISFKSISPNQAGAIDFIHQYLDNLGFTITRLDRGKTSNLIARIGNQEPIFAYAGHVDVVPPGDIKQWQFDPFTLTSHEGKLYGRGIADMKGSIASFLVALKQFLSNKNNKLPGSIMLLITSDEEAAATDGTIVMVDYLKQNNIIIDYCILGEPTSLDVLGDVIKIGRRGSLSGYLEVIGKQGHVAYPDLCKNPIHLFAKALTELSSITWDNGNDYFPATSFQFTNLNSGLGVTNVIPDNLHASFNFRYNNLHTATQLQNKVEELLKRHQLEYNVKWTESAKPFCTKPGKLIEVVTHSIKQESNLTPQLKTDGGTSDGRFLIDVCTELLELGLSNRHIHQINENIPEEDLVRLCKIYLAILEHIYTQSI